MVTLGSLSEASVRGAVVSIGNFDGVHRGHRALLTRMRELADELGRPALVITFFPPAKVLFSGADYLSSAEEKRLLLRAFAPHTLVTVPFDIAYASTDKAEFVSDLQRLEPAAIVVGNDFRFGHQRRGTLDDLAPITPRLERFGLIEDAGQAVNSSRVRALLQESDITAANRLLGAPYLAVGEVSEGQHRGHTIGYPTANLNLPPRKALPLGVFAVTVETSLGAFGGMANVGARPSFDEPAPSLEVNLFDFQGDLYGQTLNIRFQHHLRQQRRFAGLLELKTQLARDEADARAVLATSG